MSVAGRGEDVAAAVPVTGRALIPFVARPAPSTGLPSWKAALLVAVFGLTAGIGAGAAYGMRHALRWPGAREASVSMATLAHLQDQVAQLQLGVDALRTGTVDNARADEALRGVKHGLETLRQDVDQARASSAATLAANLAALSAKIDKVDHDPSQKLADIAVRLDHLEKQATAAAAMPSPAAMPASANASRAAVVPKPVAAAVAPPARGGITEVAGTQGNAGLPEKPVTVGGWVLRDVYDGVALVEARGGGLREIEPGEYLPGAGQVRSIERRGRSWVVMTSRGVIDKATF